MDDWTNGPVSLRSRDERSRLHPSGTYGAARTVLREQPPLQLFNGRMDVYFKSVFDGLKVPDIADMIYEANISITPYAAWDLL